MTEFFYSGPTARKVTCATCGRNGYGFINPYDAPLYALTRWQRKCMGEHYFRCSCGKVYPNKAGLAAHLRARTRWHPNEKHTKNKTGAK